jgi:outer membrane protein assembly factor BamB
VHAIAYDCTNGDEVWRTPLEQVGAEAGWESRGKFAPRFASALAGQVWCVSLRGRPGLTLGIDIHDGKVLWRNDSAYIGLRSRIAVRRSVLVVFGADYRAQALDPASGRALWVSRDYQN